MTHGRWQTAIKTSDILLKQKVLSDKSRKSGIFFFKWTIFCGLMKESILVQYEKIWNMMTENNNYSEAKE